ncbi:major cold shock protein CspA [bacterium BMS3Abin06]|nr:major cold shock protein CspA [bacterium BMS3Abin06]
MPDRETGTVKWFDASRSYGYVTRDQGGVIYVSYNSFRDKDSCFLVIGSRVEFVVVSTDAGTSVQDLTVIE